MPDYQAFKYKRQMNIVDSGSNTGRSPTFGSLMRIARESPLKAWLLKIADI